MLKILIADDHEIVRRGIKQILLEEYSLIEIGEASDTSSLVEKATDEDWDIIISDLSMPGGGGLDAIKKIREKKSSVPILIISIQPDEQYAARAIHMGASGYLNKNTAPEELIKAVNTILSGRRYIHPLLAEKMTNGQRKKAGLLPHELLSEQELEVMKRMAASFPDSEIARQFYLSPETVSDNRQRIMEKMDMKLNAELMRYVIENDLL